MEYPLEIACLAGDGTRRAGEQSGAQRVAQGGEARAALRCGERLAASDEIRAVGGLGTLLARFKRWRPEQKGKRSAP